MITEKQRTAGEFGQKSAEPVQIAPVIGETKIVLLVGGSARAAERKSAGGTAQDFFGDLAFACSPAENRIES